MRTRSLLVLLCLVATMGTSAWAQDGVVVPRTDAAVQMAADTDVPVVVVSSKLAEEVVKDRMQADMAGGANRARVAGELDDRRLLAPRWLISCEPDPKVAIERFIKRLSRRLF